MMNARFLLHHSEWGYYLGAFIGPGFWSKLNPIGQDYAVTFSSVKEGVKFISDTFPQTEWGKMVMVPILTKGKHHASLEEIVGAGLEGWNPEKESG